MKAYLMAVAVFSLVGCMSTREAWTVNTAPITASSSPAEAAIRNHSTLFDPNSAQFRNQRVYSTSEGDTIYCGEINAKNRMGGYVGFTPYYVRLDGRGQLLWANNMNTINFGDGARNNCASAAAGQAQVNI